MMLGDYMSVVLNTSVPSSVLKKKQNAILYHCVLEAIMSKVLRFANLKKIESRRFKIFSLFGDICYMSFKNFKKY